MNVYIKIKKKVANNEITSTTAETVGEKMFFFFLIKRFHDATGIPTQRVARDCRVLRIFFLFRK